MADYSNPKASNAILTDLQQIVALNQSAAKMDPSENSNIPNGAKRFVAVTGGYQLQIYNGSSWASTGKMIHDADTLDSYHANTETTKSTIPVRNSSGQLPGDITGNAATATKLKTARSIDIGGIATTTQQNFDGSAAITIPITQITINNEQDNAINGTLTTAHGGTGRTDGAAADVVVSSVKGNVKASAYGQVGDAASAQGVDLNTLTVTGNYVATSGTIALHWPYAAGNAVYSIDVFRNGTSIRQNLFTAEAMWTRSSSNTGESWTAWMPTGTRGSALLLYISKSGTDTNTGTTSSDPILTINRAMSIATAWQPTAEDANYVKLCIGEGDWGEYQFCSYPFTIRIYPFDGAAPSEYVSSLPVFTRINAFDCVVVLNGVVAERVCSTYCGSISISTSYNRLGQIMAEHMGDTVIQGSSSAKPIDLFSASSQVAAFYASTGGRIVLNDVRTFNIVENLNLSGGFYRALLSSKLSLFNSYPTFTLESDVTVTGKKYDINSSAEVNTRIAELNELPGSAAGTIEAGCRVGDGIWQSDNEHRFMCGNTTWVTDSDTIVAKDVAIASDTNDLASSRGQIGNAYEAGNTQDLNTYTKSGAYFINSANTTPLPESGNDGFLIVHSVLPGQNYVKQYYLIYNSANWYQRHSTNAGSTWSDWARVVMASGTTFTGNVVFPDNGGTGNYADVCLGIQAHNDSDGTTRTFYPFKTIKGGDDTGHGLLVDTGGALVLGAGEAGRNVVNLLAADGVNGISENMHLASDNSIMLYTGANDGADKILPLIISHNSTSPIVYGGNFIVACNTNIVKGTNPSSTQYVGFIMSTRQDTTSNIARVGLLETSVNSEGVVKTYISAYPFEADSVTQHQVGVCIPPSGTPYGYAPTPDGNSNTNHIATTAWVRSRNTEVNMAPNWGNRSGRSVDTTYTAATNGYAVIEQFNNHGNTTAQVKINGVTRITLHVSQYGSGGQHSGNAIAVPIMKGWTYYVTGKVSSYGWVPNA